jgi:hypothetical protein
LKQAWVTLVMPNWPGLAARVSPTLNRSIMMMLLPGRAAAVVFSPVNRAELKVVTA